MLTDLQPELRLSICADNYSSYSMSIIKYSNNALTIVIPSLQIRSKKLKVLCILRSNAFKVLTKQISQLIFH